MIDDILKGYRVLDLSQYLPGPYATRLLADLGADVVKVEPPAGDPMRRFIYLDDDGLSPLYKQVNAGKTVIRLDLKNKAGCDLFRQLLVRADVLLESYRPDVMGRLGFSRKALTELNPSLIHCALSGFGQDGPYADRAGHDITYMALSGMLSHTGTRDQPVVPFPPVSDYAGGQHAASLVIAALLRRERSGQGGYLDASLFESVLSWQTFGLAGIERAGRQLEPGYGLITGGVACYQVYRTADDRFVVLGALEEKFWGAFCHAVGHPEWSARQYEPMPQTDLINALQDLFSTAARDTWVARLAAIDCCFEPVLEPDEVVAHPQVRARRLLLSDQGTALPADIRFPALFNQQLPAARTPFYETCSAAVLECWERGSRVESRVPTPLPRR